MIPTLAGALGRSDVFCSLEESELVRLADRCHERSLGSGEIVFLRGDQGDCMYVVAAGSVAVSLSARSGRDVLLAVLQPYQTFGELAVLDGGPRVATVTARERSALVVVPKAAVAELLRREPSVAAALLTALAVTVRHLDEQACDATLLDLPRRVAKFLTTLTGDRGLPGQPRRDGFVPVDIGLTQGDLARQIGGSRQQVNRVLMSFEEAGSIERMGHRIVGVRPELLTSE
jgi:CRP/FNR family transcriptional regulator, cyclic AMP receptor protein